MKLLWGGHLARQECTSLHRKVLYVYLGVAVRVACRQAYKCKNIASKGL
ncbi:MAG: hypothetical protein F6K62_24030 [Sphaerospermopsis sp. SIO1G2]|nr:hypothetical protein [Sphaerospermopsis sp. SIO1G2]